VSALHIFDMDGTLLRGTSASIEISRHLDRLEPLRELERRWLVEEITAAQFALQMRELWHDLTPDAVAAVVLDAPWIAGIDEVCADIAARGEHSMLITMSADFFAEHLRERGIDVVCASAFPPLPFREALDPVGILQPADKVRLAEAERLAHGLAPSACVAYGDSVSDVPLFAQLQHTVAVNADPALEAIARVAYRGDDLLGAYAHGRELLEAGR
jgi:phosphoserine phosphatase